VPDPSSTALLVHDMQRYFIEPFGTEGPPIAPAIDNIARLLRHCRAAAIPVFFTAQTGGQDRRDRGLQADFWGPGMRAEAAHEAITDPLRPEPGEFRLVKHRYSAFQRSNLVELLRARGRDQLIISGVYAHIGCLLTAAEAFQRDIQPFLAADAVAAFSKATHDLALRYVAECCGVVMSTDDLVRALAPEPAKRVEVEWIERPKPAGGLTLEQMRADVAAILHEPPEAISVDDNLMDLGLDSMRVMTLLLDWSGRLGVEIDFATIAEHRTLAGWWEVVRARQAHSQAEC
jgi:bifunctional isochorismate lyase/aryl carrier protein